MMKKLLAGAAITTVALTGTHSFAATGDVEATANFLQTLTLTPTVTMNFGDVGYTAAAPAAGDLMELGTDDSITAGGNLSAEGGTVAAGQITVDASALDIDVSCNDTAVLEAGTGEQVDVVSIEYDYNTTSAFGAAAHVCDGAVDTITHTGGTDTIAVGGRLDGNTYSAGAYASGVHDTTTGAGVPITFTVVYN